MFESIRPILHLAENRQQMLFALLATFEKVCVRSAGPSHGNIVAEFCAVCNVK